MALETQQFQSNEIQKQNAQKAQIEAQGKQQDAQIDSGKMKQEQGFEMQQSNFEANKEYKLKIMELADKEKDRESKEKIAMMSKQKQNA
jgi:hypothetical protein